MVDVETNKVLEMKKYLLKSPTHFGGAKFTKMMKEFSNEEISELFTDEVIKRLERVIDYDAMTSVFRAVPGDVQEKIWESVHCQKILLGMGTTSDQELRQIITNKKFFSMQELSKRAKQGKFYYNPAKLRALEVLLRYFKSENILNSLPSNQYFQMILLCSKKVPESFYRFIDEEIVFSEIVNSDIYKLVDNISRRMWIQQVNCNCSKLLLPPDVKRIFEPTEKFTHWYYNDDKKTLGSMLHSKLYGLSSKGMKLDISKEALKQLNLQEINVLKSDNNGVVDQELVNELLSEVIDEAFLDGTLCSKKYLDTTHLDIPVQKAMFKIAVDKSIGNPQYEEKILNYLYSLLFREEYNELEKKALIISLKNALIHASEEMVANLFMNPNDLKTVFFLRFNLTARNMNYLHGIDVRQLMKLNVKHINRIVQLLYDPEQDELSDSYSKAIKMYLVFGLERTVELLGGKYPINKAFLDNVSRLDVKSVEMKAEGKKYLPVLHEEFNRFMFVANNINALFDDDNAISSSWYYLFNNFESIKETCKGHITLSQAETILREQVNTVRYDLDPDCYRLEKILYEAGLGNKGHYTNEVIYDEMCNIHKKQVRRVESTIPYVKGKIDNGWGYEVMRHEAAIAYVLGYRADCCIRTKDIAYNHLLHALLCENGRILLTYKPDGTIASFSPLKRNGEILIANSIEAIDKEAGSSASIIKAFEEGMREIQRVSKETEEKGYIKVLTIGNASQRKPEGEHWPLTIPTPTICEKDDPVYGNTDCYHRTLHIFYKDEKANLLGLKLGKVEQKYLDPRKDIIACTCDRENVLLQRKVQRIIDSVRFTNWIDKGNSKDNFEKTRLGFFNAIFCNEDWFLIVDYYGLHYECIEDDPRARKEMEAAIEVINSYGKNKEDIRKLALTYNEKKAQ